MAAEYREKPRPVGVELSWFELTEADDPDIQGSQYVLYNPEEDSSSEEWIQTDARVDVEEVV